MKYSSTCTCMSTLASVCVCINDSIDTHPIVCNDAVSIVYQLEGTSQSFNVYRCRSPKKTTFVENFSFTSMCFYSTCAFTLEYYSQYNIIMYNKNYANFCMHSHMIEKESVTLCIHVKHPYMYICAVINLYNYSPS